MRKRVEWACVAGGVALLTTLAGWTPAAPDIAPGARGLDALVLVEHLRAWWNGGVTLGQDGTGAVSLAGWPVAGAAAGIAELGVPPGLALTLVTRAVLGAWAGALWALARARGAGGGRAALVVCLGVGPWAVAQVREGALPVLGGAFVCGALAAAGARSVLVRALVPLALALAACMDAAMGAAGALALAVAAGGTSAWRVAMVGLAVMLAAHGAWVPGGGIAPDDVLAPFAGRADAVAPGIAALLALALLVPFRDEGAGAMARGAWGAILAWTLALGPVLVMGGAPVRAGGGGIPLPALGFAALAPTEVGMAGAVVVAATFVALGVAAPPRAADVDAARGARGVTLAVGAVAVAEVAWAAADGWTGVPAPGGAVVATLAERRGGVVVLPLAGGEARARWLAREAGRPLVRPAAARDVLHAEPAVVASVAVATGDPSVRVPPVTVGAGFARLGVTDLVVDRRALPAAALARLDPVLALLHGAPQRDHAAGIDVYRVPPAAGASVVALPIVRGEAGASAEGWRTVAELLGAP